MHLDRDFRPTNARNHVGMKSVANESWRMTEQGKVRVFRALTYEQGLIEGSRADSPNVQFHRQEASASRIVKGQWGGSMCVTFRRTMGGS